LATAINTEFRKLLIQQLEKVDDRFFETHNRCEEEVEGLDASVSSIFELSSQLVAQRPHRTATKRMVLANEILMLITRREKLLRVTRVLEDLLGNPSILGIQLMIRIHPDQRRRLQEDSQKVRQAFQVESLSRPV
jgi:hypothetical protein